MLNDLRILIRISQKYYGTEMKNYVCLLKYGLSREANTT